MGQKILIANRGEIAVRAIRACREMGIGTVAIYTKADQDSLHVKYADEAVCIGENKATDSYLDFYKVLSAAEVTHADAIYPGTGFLSENATFSKVCADVGTRFIGAPSDTLHMLGDKILAKQAAVRSGLPVVPASKDSLADAEACLKEAERIGYPVLLKAVGGGGGKGIRTVRAPEEMEAAFKACVNEARAAFGSDQVFLEKCLENVRHVEVQIIADSFGNAIHLFDRDCTMQRRHQKMIEEAVSPFIPPEIKEKIYADAIRIVRDIRYVGAATVEFLADRDGHYYFMEVNPRIQVEHPVTEMVTGLDIVKEQIRVALGEKLSIRTPDAPHGHAIQVRINAEDPERDFMSSIGTITNCTFPAGTGIRIETFIHDGIRITPYYDSMIAKVIAWAETREAAIQRMCFALDELEIGGLTTNAKLQKELLQTQAFADGSSHVTYVEDYLKNRQE